MMSIDQTAFEADIVTACTKHKKEHWRDDDYRACVVIKPGYFVKYDSYKTLQPQIATQSYISHYAESQADAPRIPTTSKEIKGEDTSSWNILSSRTPPLQTSPRGRQRLSSGLRGFQLLPNMSWVP